MVATVIQIFSHFSLLQLVLCIFGAGLFLFGILIHRQDTTKRRSKFFLLFTSILFGWGIAISFLGVAPHSLIYTILIILYIVAGMTPLFAFLFLDVPIVKGTPASLWHKLAVFAPPLIIALAIFSPGFIIKNNVAYDNIRGGFFFGRGYALYIAYQAIYFSAVIWSLFKKYRSSAGIFKLQARDMLAVFLVPVVVFVGLIVLYSGVVGIYDVFLFGYVSISIGTLGVGLILVKYNFWSMEIIAIKFLAVVTIFALLANFFFLNSLLWVISNAILTTMIIIASFFLVKNTESETRSKDTIAQLLYEIGETKKNVATLDKKKTEFLAIASHHLRDPLTAIKGYSSMIIDGSFGEAPPLVLDAVIKIFESSKRLISTVSDFMNISIIESGDMEYVFKDVDIGELVIMITDEMRLSAKRTGTTLDVMIDEKYKNYLVMADKSKLRQVISSLVDNAIKYTPQGRITVLLSKNSDQSKVILSVSDTGIGMDKNTLEKIFNKFSRASGANKIYTEGLGLGLYVAQEIIRAHKGRIWATSEGEGTGATFYVELDAKKI